MTIPSTLLWRYNAGIAFSPENLAFGFSSNGSYKANNKRNYGVLKAAGRFIRLGREYFDSYRTQEIPTLGHYRDYLLSRAVCAMAENLQYPDSSATAITTHANRTWMRYHFKDMWPSLPPDPTQYNSSYRYAGQLGTIAWFFQFVETEGLYPIDAMVACMRQIWILLGDGFDSDNARARHINFLARFVPPAATLNQIEVAMAKLFTIPEIHEQYRFRQILRRNLVGINDVLRLKQRILMGEYPDSVVSVGEDMISLAQTDTDFATEFGLTGVQPGVLRNFESSVLSILKPAGMLLFYQMFIAEAFIKAAQYLTSIDDDILETPVGVFMDSVGDHADVKVRIANYLATAVDAYSILAEFRLLTDVQLRTDELQGKTIAWLNSAGVERIEQGAPSRLEGFF